MALKLSLINPKIRIKPSELGYVRPDKSIVFQSPEAAQTYAKNVVIKELFSKNPHEKGVILKDNVILRELDGDKNSIDLISANIPLDLVDGATFIHGHPTLGNGKTTPISLTDFVMQCAYKFKTMVAYNADGEICRMDEVQKDSKFAKFIPKRMSIVFDNLSRVVKLKEVFSQYVKMWANLLPEDLRSYIEPLFHSRFSESFLVDSKLVAIGNELRKDEKLLNVIGEKENDLLTGTDGQKAIHDFWVQNAKKYGYKYSTNFSHFNS